MQSLLVHILLFVQGATLITNVNATRHLQQGKFQGTALITLTTLSFEKPFNEKFKRLKKKKLLWF